MSEATNSDLMQRDFVALVLGASGALGAAMVDEVLTQHPEAKIYRFARNVSKLANVSKLTRPGQITDFVWDLTQPETLNEALKVLKKHDNHQDINQDNKDVQGLKFDLVFIASGFLHDAQQQPEKSYRQITADHLLRSYQLNAVGPIMSLQVLLQQMDLKHPCKIGVLSARVGSISDNRLGGWHSYRASKAALNMLLKNLALELMQKKSAITLVGLQPGTTASALSQPFTQRISPQQLQTPQFSAQRLYRVLQTLTPAQSGQLFDFNGEMFAP